ncbi:MAG: ferritin-like domain-containing protein [Acidisphaera sp.]|nr:ferritin-like domain-containing protein [Acidisphaera sp.]
MTETTSGHEPAAAATVDRRNLFKRVGAGVAGAAAAASLATGALSLTSAPAVAQSAGDANVFNFALNLEYLEAEYYLRGVTGSGLPSGLTSGAGFANTVTGGSLVPFQTPALAYYFQRIANDELAHVEFIRAVLGSAAVGEPAIDLMQSFTTVAIAAGLIVPGQTFNPFSSEVNFLVGAYIFEDVGVTAYAGAAASLTVPANISYAASILATEAYHSGGIRGFLSDIGGGAATNAISALRASLSGVGDNGTNYNGNPFNFVNADINAQAFRRTPSQVLRIVYGGGATGGAFFPRGVNGAITS